jgi:SARP family transcriptional regulator, regulator of embCAB operon
MRFEVLGRLEVSGPGGRYAPSAPKQGILLTALLVNAGQMVPKERLIQEVWAGGPNPLRRPPTASLHVYVSQLRKFLQSASGGPDALQGCALVTHEPGYQLRLGGASLDLHEFQQAVRRGRKQLEAGSFQAAVESFENARSLYRGPLLEGLGQGPAVDATARWVEREHLECLELMIEAGISLGRHREMVNLLTSLIAQHPLREIFYRQLMLALYRSERRVEALAVYRTAHTTLRSDLGVEPSAALQDLHQAILTTDAAPELPETVATAAV